MSVDAGALSTTPEIAAVYAAFSAFVALAREGFAGELGGRLALFSGCDAAGAAIALGGNIAGAATLGLDADEDRLKLAIRNSVCDFLVNTLDEALRILKNEIRKKRPVSVCLQGNVSLAMHEIVERGVQPDILAELGSSADADVLMRRGAVTLDVHKPIDEGRGEVTWSAAEAPALWLPKVDAIAAEVLPPADERLRWLKFAPRYLGRAVAGRRYLRMTPAEAGRFAELVQEQVVSGALSPGICLFE